MKKYKAHNKLEGTGDPGERVSIRWLHEASNEVTPESNEGEYHVGVWGQGSPDRK